MTAFFTLMCLQIGVPEASSKAMSYYQSGNILWMLQWVFALIIPLLILMTGCSGKLESIAKKYGKNWFLSIVIYLALFIGLYQLLNLPLDYYSNYVREHEYGLSTQTFRRWLANYSKMTLLGFVISAAFIWIFYLLLKKSPRRWWIYSSIVGVGISFIMNFAYPIWIDPIFNQIGPLKDKQLEKNILELASRAGIEGSRVFEADKSQDTTTGNAYVVGMGSTQRIVIWDTAIKANSKESLLFLVGHEMGHYVLNHGWLLMGGLSIFFFLIAYLIYKVTNCLLPHCQKRFGFQHLYEIASFPLILFLVSFFILLSTPLYNSFSRYIEREADRFGLEITRNNEAAATLFANAVHDHLVNPHPGVIYKIWRSHHPSLGDRVGFCNEYRPWETGSALKYDSYFEAVADIEKLKEEKKR